MRAFNQNIKIIRKFCETKKKIGKIYEIISNDMGSRGIGQLTDFESYLKSCENFYKSESVVLVSGFTLSTGQCETDGPLGSFSVLKTALKMNKKIALITDSNNFPFFNQMCQNFLPEHEKFKKNFKGVFSFEKPYSLSTKKIKDLQDFERKIEKSEYEYSNLADYILKDFGVDHVICLEHNGPSADGNCYSMSGKKLPKTPKTEFLMKNSKKFNKLTTTTCIGDGGNEMGFGKKLEGVKKHVPHGEKIGCVVSADEMIICGVSNWGGFALSASAYILENKKDNFDDWMITQEEHHSILQFLIEKGMVDGVKFTKTLSVDNLNENHHNNILKLIKKNCSF